MSTKKRVIIIGAGFNLLPFKTNGSPSDGLGIITSPFKTDADIELHLVSFELRKIERLQESDETEEALALFHAPTAASQGVALVFWSICFVPITVLGLFEGARHGVRQGGNAPEGAPPA